LALSKLPQDEWSRDDIENREKSALDALVGFLSSHFPPSTSSSSAL
jgi:hypothetical protein